jgi:hypothetical protein
MKILIKELKQYTVKHILKAKVKSSDECICSFEIYSILVAHVITHKGVHGSIVG